jgi:integrase
MAILAECLTCHKKQSVKNKICKCSDDLVKAKKSKRVKFWISYRLPGGKQKREYVGYSIEEARDAQGKRRSQKRENRIFDIKPDARMSFNKLSKWYLDLDKVKSKAYYPTLTINLSSFNGEFGDTIVNQLKPVDLENYQAKRKTAGYADSYIDQEIGGARTMINKAFDNDLVSGDTLKVFKKVKKLLKRNANARDRILSQDEFENLSAKLHMPTTAIVATGYYAGMRESEILNLIRPKVDFKKRIINLDAADTKDGEPREVPMCDKLYTILKNIPIAVHDNHLFLYKGKPIKDIRTGLKRACRDANIKYGRFVKGGFVFHDLRHTFNTNMRKAGVSESVIMAITGHSSREMFDRYNTIDEDDIRKAVNQMQGFLSSVDQTVDQKGISQ